MNALRLPEYGENMDFCHDLSSKSKSRIAATTCNHKWSCWQQVCFRKKITAQNRADFQVPLKKTLKKTGKGKKKLLPTCAISSNSIVLIVLKEKSDSTDHFFSRANGNSVAEAGFGYFETISGWWLNQPIWKICASQIGIISPIFGVKIKKNIWNHHPDFVGQSNGTSPSTTAVFALAVKLRRRRWMAAGFG